MKALRLKISMLSLIAGMFLLNVSPVRAINQESGEVIINHQVNPQAHHYTHPTMQVFFNVLSPYGSWVQYRGYGYCWVPRLGPDFVPYASNGHWVYTDHGWQWFSNYPWGWATFHYGRWVLDDTYGWIWVPGTDWAPAWVVWGHYHGYYGWAPLAPGVTLSLGYRPPVSYWTFIPERYMGDENFGRYIIHDRSIVHSNIGIIFNAHSYRNVTYDRGPKVDVIERVTGRKFYPVNLRDVNHPMSHHEINDANRNYRNSHTLPVYRPTFDNRPGVHAVPPKVEKLENLKHHRGAEMNKGRDNNRGRDNNKGRDNHNDDHGHGH